ncbi:MAG: PAS domain S-box protein, partial [Cyclobacteriaceae bacterium]
NNKNVDIIQSIDGIVWEAYLKTFNSTFVSQKVKDILGYTAEEWMAVHECWHNHIHPEDREKVLSHNKTEMAAGRDHRLEYRMIAADGREVWINDLVTVVREKGIPVALRGLMVDITQRKLVEKELALSEQRFKSLVQNGSDLIAILDLEANYLYVNLNSTNILGITPDEFIGNNAFDFIHPEDKERVFSDFSEIENSQRITIAPFRFIHKDGTWRWIETIVTNLIDDPSIKGIVANSRDITEKIITEQKVKLSEKRFKALVQEGADLTAILSREGEFLYISPNYPKTLGYSEEELLGSSSLEFFHPEDLPRVKEEFSQLNDEKRLKSSPYRYRKKDGDWCWVQSTVTD